MSYFEKETLFRSNHFARPLNIFFLISKKSEVIFTLTGTILLVEELIVKKRKPFFGPPYSIYTVQFLL